jgi:cobalt-zinc-cadmium efflux system membrane fusion protein
VQAQATRLADTVALFQALGGGWWNRLDRPRARANLPEGCEACQRPGPWNHVRGKRLVAAESTTAGVLAVFADGTEVRAAMLVGADGLHSASRRLIDPAAPSPREVDAVRVTEDQMHQLRLATVEPFLFRNQKPAIGQIAFNEDRSTVVVTPFSGRVIRVIGKIGDEIKRGDPLFEIDSPEVVTAQTDLIAALQRHKGEIPAWPRQARARPPDQPARRPGDLAREVDQANADHAAAGRTSPPPRAASTPRRNRLRVIIGRDQAEVDRLERERMVNPLITINAPLDGTIIARKVGPGQYVRADAGDQLYAIADLSVMWLKANVPEVDIPLVKVGQELEVRVTALPERVFRARVTAIGAASDAATRRVVVRSEIPNPDGALRAEMFASFKIATGDGENALAVRSTP